MQVQLVTEAIITHLQPPGEDVGEGRRHECWVCRSRSRQGAAVRQLCEGVAQKLGELPEQRPACNPNGTSRSALSKIFLATGCSGYRQRPAVSMH